MSKKPLSCVIFIVISAFSFANDEYKLKNQYGKNLYENPRGIACNKCHGPKGEGSVIARYKHKGVDKSLYAPQINHIGLDTFAKALRKQNGVMPRYFLTDDEIEAIYIYLYRP